MLPALFVVLRTYAPYIVWPAAAVIGVVGYNIEAAIRGDKEPAWKTSSTVDDRHERRWKESTDPTQVDSLKDKTFVPKNIFEKNK